MKVLMLSLLLVSANLVYSQEDQPAATSPPETAQPAVQPVIKLKLNEFESAVVLKLREQFPRLPAFFTLAHSCRLPGYGPLVSVTIQPPSTFFVRPVLWQLEQKQKSAEAQAKRVRDQIDFMAQLLRLRAKEADLVEKISVEEASHKKGKPYMSGLEKDLEDTRKTLQDMETQAFNLGTNEGPLMFDSLSEVDLDNMIRANYQDLVRKVTEAISTVLADHATQLELNDTERVTITTSIRDNYLGNPDQTILFVLNPEDIHAYRNGALDAEALRKRILIEPQDEEQ